MKYVSVPIVPINIGRRKEQLGLSAVLIRPDGMIAWASDSDPDGNELQKAAARWFVCNAGFRH
jgi:hypothetical protein